MPYKDRERQREFQKRWDRKKKEDASSIKKRLKSGGCIVCGEMFEGCLAFHHVDPSTKGKWSSDRYNPRKIEQATLNCVVVCHNCHAKIHAGVLFL